VSWSLNVIIRSTQGQVAVLTIDRQRQRQRNALDIEHCLALAAELDAAVGMRCTARSPSWSPARCPCWRR